jgi:hypothetical protein
MSLSWEDASFVAIQEFPKILWTPKVHYRVHKIPLLVHILGQINPVHTTPFYLSKIHFNIVTHMPIAKQWLGKFIAEDTLSTI